MPTLVTFRPHSNLAGSVGILRHDGVTCVGLILSETTITTCSFDASIIAQRIELPTSHPAVDTWLGRPREELANERAKSADANARAKEANLRATRLSAELSALRAQVVKPVVDVEAPAHEQSPALAALVSAQRQAIDALTAERDKALSDLATLRASVRSVVDGAEK